MNTDDFTKAARAEAERKYSPEARLPAMKPTDRMDELPRRCAIDGFVAGAVWGREQALAQEPTDAEVLAALNAEQPWAAEDDLDGWPEGAVLRMRAALSAARAARRDEETW